MEQRWIGTPIFVALIGVPVTYAFLAQITYGIALRIGGFFPNGMYWFLLMGITLLGGIIALSLDRTWNIAVRSFAVAVYALVMGGILFLLQGVVSCLNGDCF